LTSALYGYASLNKNQTPVEIVHFQTRKFTSLFPAALLEDCAEVNLKQIALAD
jgi:hypothetical protein